MLVGDLVRFWTSVRGWEVGIILDFVPYMRNDLDVVVLRSDGCQVFRRHEDLEVISAAR
jgi:hypothetical protein